MGHHWLAHYFSDLAESWRGWDGTKAWFGYGLRIEAIHDQLGHIALEVSVWEGSWYCNGTIVLEPGGLEAIATSLNVFFGICQSES